MLENDSTLSPAAPAGVPPPLPEAVPPMAALAFSTPMEERRPGVLRAIGIISMVVAGLTVLAALRSIVTTRMFYVQSQKAAASAAPSAAPPVVAPKPPAVLPPVAPPAGAKPARHAAANGAEQISVSANVPASNAAMYTFGPGGSPASNMTTPAPPLTSAEIQGAITRAQAASGNKLNSAQIATLTAALQNPNQQLIAPGTAWSPVRSVTVNPDGSAFVFFTGAFITIDPQGQITSTTPVPGGGNPFSIKLSGETCGMVIADALVSIALAVYLFFAGWAVMKHLPSGRRKHINYAILKIPLSILGGFVMAAMMQEIYSGMAIPGFAGPMLQIMAIVIGVGTAVIGLIYPIALLFAMNSRRVKEYYRAI